MTHGSWSSYNRGCRCAPCREAAVAYMRARRKANPEPQRAAARAYRLRHPEKYAESTARYKARKRGNGIEPYERAAIYVRDGGKCHLCGKRVGQDFHIDHLVPISAGGADAEWNVAIAHPLCNIRRGNRGPAQLRLI